MRAWLVLGSARVVRVVGDSLATVFRYCEGDVEGWIGLFNFIGIVRLTWPVLVASFLLGSRL